MWNRIIFLITTILLTSLSSCKKNHSNSHLNDNDIHPIVTINNGVIDVTSLNNLQYNIQVSILGDSVYNKSFTDSWHMNILAILQQHKDYNELAYLATESVKNEIPIKLTIKNVVDTTFNYAIKPTELPEFQSAISGKCAPIFLSSHNPQLEVRLKKWLFNKGKNIGEYRINTMVGIIRTLLKDSEYKLFESNSEIPIIKTFSESSYIVKSNMKADYYVLFASSSEKEIKNFIEEIVSNNFELTTNSIKHPMKCFRDVQSKGYKCISLIGINKDWSYQTEPLGLICIDNQAPSEYPIEIKNEVILELGNDTYVMLPSNKYPYEGYATLATRDFGGNGVSCMVSFSIEFGGDIKSLTIKRNDILSKWVGKENKVINLEDEKSPYYFTYELHLEEGDNYVPVIIQDLRGNKTEYKLNIPSHFVRNESPQIEIDNNIDIWN